MLKITAILLAAGSSSRFGGDKLVMPLDNGLTLLEVSASKLCDVMSDVIAVIGPEQTTRSQLLKSMGINAIVCPNAKLGIGESLAYSVEQTADSDGWLVALADMPFLKTQTLERLNQSLLAGSVLTAPYYRQRRGHPVGISRQFLPDLLQLKGDCGARHLFTQGDEMVVKIETDDIGIVRDIDYPSDLN